MATRASEVLQYTTIRPYTVASGQTATRGYGAKHSGADLSVATIAAVGDDAIGIFLDDGAALTNVRVAHFGNGVVKAKVGTGGATRGSAAKYAANGLTNATVGGATTKLVVCGQWMETAVVGDLAALNLGMASFTVGS
jgi:hypothetical protein